ncbi:hypothetical protein GCM10010495_65680 [Kitasatospora herbaricolor]|nr:hypothetical protein GCM10010495_65680 [Kitasatospora herbaricolor]
MQDGDGTGGRAGWPAGIRGHHQRYRGTRSSTPQVEVEVGSRSTRYPGEGAQAAGARAGRSRQWGSKPGKVQDGRRGWLPDTVTLRGRHSGTRQFAVQQY